MCHWELKWFSQRQHGDKGCLRIVSDIICLHLSLYCLHPVPSHVSRPQQLESTCQFFFLFPSQISQSRDSTDAVAHWGKGEAHSELCTQLLIGWGLEDKILHESSEEYGQFSRASLLSCGTKTEDPSFSQLIFLALRTDISVPHSSSELTLKFLCTTHLSFVCNGSTKGICLGSLRAQNLKVLSQKSNAFPGRELLVREVYRMVEMGVVADWESLRAFKTQLTSITNTKDSNLVTRFWCLSIHMMKCK